MKKVEEPTVRKTLTVATSRIHWQPLIGLVAAIAVMSMVVPSSGQLHHVPPAAPSFTVLYTFAGPPTDGAIPYAGLIRDAAGNLYGTTSQGGASGYGTVFKLSPTGTETILHSFTGGADGGSPYAGLVQDAAGNLYGTTNTGGAYDIGVVFKVSPTGIERVVHSFTGADGAYPYASLILDPAGNLYGTARAGGAYDNGVVFKLSPTGTDTVLYSFTGGADGGTPYAGLTRDTAGNLYGTAARSACRPYYGCGMVFKLSPNGTETALHTFTGGGDGAYPTAGLVRDAAGNLYGTTYYGGAVNAGVVFELIRCGSAGSGYEFRVLHTFTGGADGGGPFAGLTQDAAGNLYGTGGVVFKLSPTGTETVLYNLGNADPMGGLVQDLAGNLYGTTAYGGASGNGVVFKLAP